MHYSDRSFKKSTTSQYKMQRYFGNVFGSDVDLIVAISKSNRYVSDLEIIKNEVFLLKKAEKQKVIRESGSKKEGCYD